MPRALSWHSAPCRPTYGIATRYLVSLHAKRRGPICAWPSSRVPYIRGQPRGCDLRGINRRLVEKEPYQKGFVAWERRWIVELTLAALAIGAPYITRAPIRSRSQLVAMAGVASPMAADASTNSALGRGLIQVHAITQETSATAAR